MDRPPLLHDIDGDGVPEDLFFDLSCCDTALRIGLALRAQTSSGAVQQVLTGHPACRIDQHRDEGKSGQDGVDVDTGVDQDHQNPEPRQNLV